MKTTFKWIVLVLLLCCTLITGCSKKETTVPTTITNSTNAVVLEVPITQPDEYVDEFNKTIYRTIHTMGTMYNVLMGTAGNLYKEKVLTEEQKNKMIDLGYIYYGSYQTLVTAFEAYQKVQSDDGRISITLLTIETVKKYNIVLEYYNDVTKGVKGVQQWTKM